MKNDDNPETCFPGSIRNLKLKGGKIISKIAYKHKHPQIATEQQHAFHCIVPLANKISFL